MAEVRVESISSWEGSICLGLSEFRYLCKTLGRCGYGKEETMKSRMILEVQLLGRDQTWYSVLKRDTRMQLRLMILDV